MTQSNERPSSPIRCQARPKSAAIPLVIQERLQRTWYNVSSGPWRASDLPRVEIVRLDLGYTLVDLPRTWFEFRDIEQRRLFFDGAGTIKCLQVYPHDWYDMSDEQLLELFERAAPIQ